MHPLYAPHQLADFWQQRFAFLEVSLADNVFTLRLNRPDKRNAMNPKMMEEIAYALAYCAHAPEVWMVVLEANGPVFCAGADLKAWAGDAQDDQGSTIPPASGEVLLGELFVKVHKPCIAKVDAPVYAGGHLLVGGCVYVVATENAVFGLPEVKRGVFPMQVMATLMQTLPARRVLDWCIRGATLSAAEAHQLGFVTHFVERNALESTVQDLIDELKQNSPTAIRMGLEAYDALRGLSGTEAHAYLKGMLAQLLQSEDAREGLAAFKEKRAPQWSGK